MAGRDMSVYVNIGGKVHSSLSAAINTAESKLTALSRSLKAQAAAQKAAIAGMMSSFKGMAALAAGGGLAFSVKKAFGAGEDYAHEIQKLRSAGRTVEEIAEGIAKANETIRELPTGALTGSIKLLNETTGAFGDYKHAVENLPFNSKLASVLQLGSGSEDPEHDIGSLIKALEIRGSASNPEKYRREAGELQRAMTFFGGRLKADQIYTFASNAQQGIRQLNERFLTKIAPSLVQEMGGDKVGTGLTAFRTIISGRKITDKKQAAAWKDLGLLNEKDIIKNKQGDVTGWRDGAIKGTRLAYEDPLEFMEKVVLKQLKDKKHVDIADPIKLGAALNTLFKNTKAAAFVTAISTVVDRARLKKDEDLINKVLDLNKQYDSALVNDPKLALRALQAALTNLGTALTAPLQTPFAQALVRTGRAIQWLAGSLNENRRLAKVIGGIAVALSSMMAIRIASFVFGLSGLARALALLMIAAPLGAAGRLIGVAKGIAAISVAASLGLATRVRAIGVAMLAMAASVRAAGGIAALAAIRFRALALGVMMLGGGGIARMALGSLALGLAGLARGLLLFPIYAIRGIAAAMWLLVANPVGAVLTAIVAALTALGIWVYNNWSGIKGFFLAFGETFMRNLGPGAAQGVTSLMNGLKSVWDWLNKLLGPIDESGAKWVEWGALAGRGAAQVVNALVELPGKIKQFFVDAIESVKNIDWSSVGSAIVDGIVSGITAGAAKITNAIRAAVKAGAGWLTDKLGLGAASPAGAAPAAPTAPAIGHGGGLGLRARAMGGPVAKGLPYLVGERGPEIFVPNGHGSIKTNGYLSSLGGAGGPTVDMSGVGNAEARAQRAGLVLHQSLDATLKPAVDTSGIDEATEKASKLASILSTIGASGINVGGLGLGGVGGGGGGGPGGGGGGGHWGGKALGVGGGVGPGHSASQAERAAFTRQYASSIGLDPTTALRVSQSEGFYKYHGDHGKSFGEWQLFTGGGLGNIAMRRGINIRDPKTWREQTKFALNWAKTHGWGDWHGAAKVGISRWRGIHSARANGGPVGGGLPYLVGERGPEVFTPGESGRIASNHEIAALTDPSAVARLAGKDGVSVSHTRGDTHYSPSFTIQGGGDVGRIKSEVEGHFWELVRQAEGDQRGLLSD